MGDYLRADLERIQTAAGELRHLHTEFSSAQDIVDDYRSAIGSDVLSKRLDTFVDNWKHHRTWLCESLDVVAGAAQAAYDTYSGIEDELTQALLGSFESSGVAV